MDGSQWRGLTKRGPLEKGMANHFSILALRTPWTVWKGKKIGHWKMNSSGWLVFCMLQRTVEKEVTPEKMKRWSQSKNNTGDGSKVQCCEEQYCTGTWIVRSMNQGKLEVVKQEMARVSIDTSGVGELELTGMGEFNSDAHFIYYCG